MEAILPMSSPALCPRYGKRQVAFSVGDGVPLCSCETPKHGIKYIHFNDEYWKVEDLELEVVEGEDG